MFQGVVDKKVDVWATGVVLFILLFGYPPFEQSRSEQRGGRGWTVLYLLGIVVGRRCSPAGGETPRSGKAPGFSSTEGATTSALHSDRVGASST